VGPNTPTFDRILRLAYGYRETKALLSAVELGVFTALGDDAVEFEALRHKVGVHTRGARDFFDALVAMGLLDRDAKGRYCNMPDTARYLDRNKPTYQGYELEFINASLYAKWSGLSASLKSGEPQMETDRSGPYARRYGNRQALEQFAAAMTASTMPIAAALTIKFPWQQYRTFVDIGCAEGCLPVRLVQEFNNLTGIGFDLPPMEPVFDAYVAKHCMTDRISFHPGDFLQAGFPSANVLIMGRVLHNWDLDIKKLLLRKAYDALPSGGCLIVYERFIDDERKASAIGLLASLNMLLMTPGGFDFTAADCRDWLKETGFSIFQIDTLTGDQGMVVGIK
jgi:O-methyltransferase domain/Dimerisation domain